MNDYLIAAGLVALSALMLGILWWRARKHRDDPPSDSGGFL